ncbi:Uncharacterised protein [Streptococcus suis]|nr:Uncharacterised protein [Streptococcus suis]CYV34041.1 Uncharacterised protein [Streptococcus suis]
MFVFIILRVREEPSWMSFPLPSQVLEVHFVSLSFIETLRDAQNATEIRCILAFT